MSGGAAVRDSVAGRVHAALRVGAAALVAVTLSACGAQVSAVTGAQARGVGTADRVLDGSAITPSPDASAPEGSSAGDTSDGAAGGPASGSAGVPGTDLPAGATSVVEAGEGFAVVLPAGFSRVTAPGERDRAITTSAYYRALPAGERKAYLAQMRAALKLYAVNTRTRRSLVVVVHPAPQARPSDVLEEADALRTSLTAAKATSIKVVRTTIDRLPAIRATYRTAAGSGRTATVQYLVVTNERFYVVSMNGTTLAPTETTLLARTLRFPDGGSATI